MKVIESVTAVHKGDVTVKDNASTQDRASKTCACLSSDELEGLKLDLTVLESRVLSATSQSELELDVGPLAVTLKEMEAAIRQSW